MNKKGNPFKTFSPEQLEEMRQQAVEARQAKIEWAKDNLRDDYLDFPLWRELASKHGVRLPQRHIPATEVKYIKRVFKAKGMDINQWLKDGTGCSSIPEVARKNPDAPAYAMVGWALEWIEEKEMGLM